MVLLLLWGRHVPSWWDQRFAVLPQDFDAFVCNPNEVANVECSQQLKGSDVLLHLIIDHLAHWYLKDTWALPTT